MPFIPDDILDESIGGDINEHHVLLSYATLQQREGTEPDISRIAERARLPLDTTQQAFARLTEKGWIDRVRDYSE